MSRRVVECVPNFSEGRDLAKIKQITDAIEAVAGVQLLDVDPGADTNRTVVTFVGSPEAVAEGAFVAIAKAAQVLDMTTHHGAHPRMGATDVCPFVPVEGVTIEECAEIARQVGERVGRELGIPVYLYEAAAAKPERRNLAVVRAGEYEGLKEKLADPAWAPDFGPAQHNAKAGATAIGAREFLIAYNITLNTRDKSLANDIALDLREKGRVARVGASEHANGTGKFLRYAEGAFPCGNCGYVGSSFGETEAHVREAHGYELRDLLRQNDVDADNVVGEKVYRRGRFAFVKAIGWYVDAYDRAQISVNLTDYHVTPPHEVLEAVRAAATQRGLVVTGSEIVGLVPFQALYEAGQYYLRRQGKTPGVPVGDVLKAAKYSMGLGDVQPFDLEGKVLGTPRVADDALVAMTVADFADEVSRDTPAPGGGSIAALAGALGASLASMVSSLTQGSKYSTPETDPELIAISLEAQRLKDALVRAVDDDTNAFTAYVEAKRLPQGTEDEKAAREQAIQDGLKQAIEVPLATAQASLEAMKLADRVAHIGNPNSVTDGAVGVQCGWVGVRGGVWNALINLTEITDEAYVASLKSRTAGLVDEARALMAANEEFVNARIAELTGK